MSARLSLRPFALALALSTVVGAARAQFAAPSEAAMNAPWARAYQSCTEAEAMRQIASRQPRPSAQETLERAEKACETRLPGAGLGFGEGPPAVIAAASQVRAAVHRDLANRLRDHPDVITTTTLVPPRPVAQGRPPCPTPDYPAAALRSLAQGETRVRVTVDERGHVTQAELVQSSGDSREHRLLDQAALDTFRQCVFPAQAGGGPRTTTLSYTWKID
jgi:TonB family protein